MNNTLGTASSPDNICLIKAMLWDDRLEEIGDGAIIGRHREHR